MRRQEGDGREDGGRKDGLRGKEAALLQASGHSQSRSLFSSTAKR